MGFLSWLNKKVQETEQERIRVEGLLLDKRIAKARKKFMSMEKDENDPYWQMSNMMLNQLESRRKNRKTAEQELEDILRRAEEREENERKQNSYDNPFSIRKYHFLERNQITN